MPERRDPSSVVWDWRRRAAGPDAAAARAREAAAARRRGVIGGAVGLAVAVLFYFFWRPGPAGVVAAVAVFLTVLALAAPLTAYKTVTGWIDRFAHAVAAAVTWVLMTVLYYLFFLPAGLLLRARHRLQITRGADPALPSYWRPISERSGIESYRKQF
jgi:hypothetical protein